MVSGEFRGKSAVITGAGGGIGARVAERLAGEGCRLAVLDAAAPGLEVLRARLAQEGTEVIAEATDVASEESVQHAFARVADAWKSLDFLVNCAGIAGPVAPLEHVNPADWHRTMDVNLTGIFLCCRQAIPLLRIGSGKAIVNIASVTGKRPLVRRTAYAASKLGVIGLTRTLAVELGADGIRVNAVSPSGVVGDRLDQVIASAAQSSGRSPEAIREAARRESALGRFVTVDEVASTVQFLLSGAASGLTGQDLNVSVGTVMY